MNEIIAEKSNFILENKDVLLANMSISKFYLFSILNNDKPLKENENYNKLNNILDSYKKKREVYETSTEAVYIIYFLLSFLDKINGDLKIKEKQKEKLYQYIDCLIPEEDNQKKLINIK